MLLENHESLKTVSVRTCCLAGSAELLEELVLVLNGVEMVGMQVKYAMGARSGSQQKSIS